MRRVWMMTTTLMMVAACGAFERIEDAGTGGTDAVATDAPTIDTPVDASIDTPIDTPIDAPIDALPIDAPIDAPAPRCGDGTVDPGEACDDGVANGSYGACDRTCTGPGLRCGDGVVNGPESCDSGRANGSYGACNLTCTGPGPRCGDRILNGPERCDAGTVYSDAMPAGVCRPDCAGVVVERMIAVTDGRLSPAQGGVTGADARCQAERGAGYRALVVDGSRRIASTTPYSGAGQVDWVLAPYTRYLSAETGQLVFVTDATRLLGAAGGVGVDLRSPIRAADDGWGAWTGANRDWTAGPNCAAWSSSASTDSGLSCNTTATTPTTFPNNGGVSNCAQLRRFFCVQQ